MRLWVYFWLQQDVKPLPKLSIIVYFPPQLEDLTFGEISTFMKRNVLLKNLVIAERTKFFENRQNVNGTAMQYLHKLKEATSFTQTRFERKVYRRRKILRLIKSMYAVAYKRDSSHISAVLLTVRIGACGLVTWSCDVSQDHLTWVMRSRHPYHAPWVLMF